LAFLDAHTAQNAPPNTLYRIILNNISTVILSSPVQIGFLFIVFLLDGVNLPFLVKDFVFVEELVH
jgi:hypothetical protein